MTNQLDEGSRGLRSKIVDSLISQGFSVDNGKIHPPGNISKNGIRNLHQTAVDHRINQAKPRLYKKESGFLEYIASGHEVNPQKISPVLVEINSKSYHELLFRYACLHWSIPVSSGYGRRLRFLVMDEYNGKLIGVIGLGDPVYNLGPRDRWIGWSPDEHGRQLKHVMDAFVLGAVPPYSFLLCGKLVAMLVASDAVQSAFKAKYGETFSLISQDFHKGHLALITTTSALGRSSVYNRLRYRDRLLYKSVGFTKGSGEFHFSNGLYAEILNFTKKHCKPSAKQKKWGNGFRNRREVLKKCLPLLGLSNEWLYHGVEREVFVVPLASNTQEFLRGEDSLLIRYRESTKAIFDWFKERWLLPRAQRMPVYKDFEKEEYRVWR